MTAWTLDPDDFAALWYGDANDRFPNPLHYHSRFGLRDEFDAHRITVRERYPFDELEHIELAMHTLSTSTVRIEILGGTTKHKGNDGSVRIYRIVGATNVYHSVTLFQSASGGNDGAIRIEISSPEELAARLVRLIPECLPGAHPAATFHPEDLRFQTNSYFEDVARNTPRERYQRLLGRPADGGGSAGLLTGSVNSVSAPQNVLQWRDITDDGRYTEVTGAHITVSPTTPADLVNRFTAWIDEATQRMADDETFTW
ncbi:ESX secretion-associated protein EspG [Nocardia sp. CNY236]|uniref:ESX secretion-associated protein EspG n=1 Tax=Nocardia sp. CNY236 TaxID=1169152 RepID=UPI000418BCA0|nr:ESX secretion-associated protein EspG [Nocardia sp. CNY236]